MKALKTVLATLAVIFAISTLSNSTMAQSAPADPTVDSIWYASVSEDETEESFQIDLVDDKTINFIERSETEGSEAVEKKWTGKMKFANGEFSAKFDEHTVGDKKIKAELSFTGHFVKESGGPFVLRIIRSSDRRLLRLVWSNKQK